MMNRANRVKAGYEPPCHGHHLHPYHCCYEEESLVMSCVCRPPFFEQKKEWIVVVILVDGARGTKTSIAEWR